MSKNIQLVKLGQLLNITTGKLDVNASSENGIYPFFTCAQKIYKINTYAFDDEAVLVAGNGDLNVKYYNGKFNAYQRTYVLTAKNNEIDIKYLYFFMQTYIQKLRDKSIGGVIKYIKLGNLTDAKIPFLPLQDQQKIAQLLTQIEELINKREESIKLLDELTKSTFLEMFGDPVLNPRKLKKEKIKKFGKIVTGNTPPRVEDKYYDNNFIEWVKTDNLFDDQLFATEAKEYLSEEGLRVGRKVKAGSLLVTCIAGSVKSIGTSCLVDRAVSFNQQINAIEPYEGIDSYFLYQLFKVSKLYVQNQAGKGMKKIITKSTFEDILFPMPDKDSQKRFGEIFQNVYNLRIIYQNSLTELNNLFGSIAQKAFKGELDVSKIELILKEQEEITMAIKLDEKILLEEIKKGDFEASKYVNEHQNYDAIKDMIFTLIEDGKISQELVEFRTDDEKISSKIELRAN